MPWKKGTGPWCNIFSTVGKLGDASTILISVFFSLSCWTKWVEGALDLLTPSTSVVYDGTSRNSRGKVISSTLHLVSFGQCSSFFSLTEQSWLFSNRLWNALKIFVARYHCASSTAWVLSSTICETILTLSRTGLIAVSMERILVCWIWGLYPCPRLSTTLYMNVLLLHRMSSCHMLRKLLTQTISACWTAKLMCIPVIPYRNWILISDSAPPYRFFPLLTKYTSYYLCLVVVILPLAHSLYHWPFPFLPVTSISSSKDFYKLSFFFPFQFPFSSLIFLFLALPNTMNSIALLFPATVTFSFLWSSI